jgi:hypothetical protein
MEQLDDCLGFSLQKAVEADVPDDIIYAVLDRALHAAAPIAESWLEQTSLGPMYGGDPFQAGINSARGQSALVLGALVATDADGHRTALITPSLGDLAGDPIMAVRACVAHVLSASIRHARDAVVAVMPTYLAWRRPPAGESCRRAAHRRALVLGTRALRAGRPSHAHLVTRKLAGGRWPARGLPWPAGCTRPA